MRNNELLSTEIKSGFEEVSCYNVSMDEYEKALNNVLPLYDRYLKEKEIDASNRNREFEVKKHRDEMRLNYIRIGAETALGAAGICIMLSVLAFEEHGTVRSQVGRVILNKLIRIK